MSFRETLDKPRDGEATGTGVFMGARYNGFPEDGYGNSDTIANGTPLNYRAGFMLEQRMTNLLRAGREDIEFDSDGVRINGYSIEEINEELEAEGNGSLTLINSGTFNREIRDRADGSHEIHNMFFDTLMDQGAYVINPPDIARACADKRVTYSIFEDELDRGLGWFNLDYYLEGKGVEGLAEDFEQFRDAYNLSSNNSDRITDVETQYGDVPVVCKPANGSGGDEIMFTTMEKFITKSAAAGSIDGLFEEELEGKESNPGNRILQMSVPALFDQRVIAADETVESAEIRIGNGSIHNLSGGGKGLGVKRSEIQGGVRRFISDHSRAFMDAMDAHDNAGSFIGWDALGFDLYDDRLEGFPDYKQYLIDHVVDDRYSVDFNGKEVHLVLGEANDSPGSKIDEITVDHPEQNSALALLKYAEDLSRGFDHVPYQEDHFAPAYRKAVREEFGDL